MNNIKTYPIRHSAKLCFSLFIILYSPLGNALEYSVSPFISYFDYQEFDENDDELLNELGPLAGIEFALMGEVGRVRSSIELSYLVGEVDYQGRTQSGSPYETKTQQNIIHYGASIGYRYPINELGTKILSIQPDLKILAYHWRRDIQSRQQVTRLVEDYNGFIIQPSMLLTYTDYQVQLGLTRTLNNTMTIQPTSCIDRVTVKPKSENGWFTQGQYRFFKNDIYSASIWASYKNYRMNASDVEAGSTCFGPVGWAEPTNEIELWQLGARFIF